MKEFQKALFFKEMNSELDEIVKNYNINEFDNWKIKVLKNLDGYYKFRLEKFNAYDIFSYSENEEDINRIKTLLRDMYFKYNNRKKKTKENIEIEKLLKARENNLDFDKEISEMICGDNYKFPYRSSYFLTDFFQKLKFDFKHSNEKRVVWVENKLNQLNIKDIHYILSNGLFNKKYFKKYVEEQNLNATHEVMLIDTDEFYKEAQLEFETFIKESINYESGFNLSAILDLNVNIELLFENRANTKDNELNSLIEEAKKRFLSNDKQIGLEKLWDAFERLKTFYERHDKKTSVKKIVNIISESFDTDLIDTEFITLTNIGNNYRIRHHETNKKELSKKHINYFFFRMLSLIDLYLMYYNEIEDN
ncbi:transcriptional regulator [Aliarcobacter cryaerophilus]|uniref:hypothetical protein n=1 Tax=Aliarcobacter cryaerophilus TaxID=28198 RepID=UPI000836254F|nr:hypothetical protein [Aliarcobacter cryaerophilus]